MKALLAIALLATLALPFAAPMQAAAEPVLIDGTFDTTFDRRSKRCPPRSIAREGSTCGGV